MADDTDTNVMDPDAVAAANAAVKDKVENQGREDLISTPTQDSIKSTTDSLDSLAKKAEEDAAAAAADKAKADDAPDKPIVDVAPVKKDGDADAAPVVPKDDAAAKAADDIFKGVSLPSGASPKSAEAFSTIKLKAAQEISARDLKIAEQQKLLEENSQKLKNPVPPEIERELKEHREWRAKLDVEYDPKFKEYTKGIDGAREFIYAQLKRGGLADDLLEKIKKYGGPENVDLAKVFERGGPDGREMDGMTRRLVESKIADIEQMKFNREQAIKTARENISEYVKSQEAERVKGASAHNDTTRSEFTKLTAGIDWLKPIAPEKNDEASKKAAEERNGFVEKIRKDMELALQDDSAEMRAIMVAGMGQLFYTRRQLAESEAKLAASEKSLKEITAKMDKHVNASRSRLPESGASTTPTPAAAPKVDYGQSAGESLDSIAKRVMEERTRAANQPSA